MLMDEVRAYFGSDNKTCIALGIKRQNFLAWRKHGGIPIGTQCRLEILSNYELKADIRHAPAKGYSRKEKVIKDE